jgi:hypothetical protein
MADHNYRRPVTADDERDYPAYPGGFGDPRECVRCGSGYSAGSGALAGVPQQAAGCRPGLIWACVRRYRPVATGGPASSARPAATGRISMSDLAPVAAWAPARAPARFLLPARIPARGWLPMPVPLPAAALALALAPRPSPLAAGTGGLRGAPGRPGRITRPGRPPAGRPLRALAGIIRLARRLPAAGPVDSPGRAG